MLETLCSAFCLAPSPAKVVGDDACEEGPHHASGHEHGHGDGPQQVQAARGGRGPLSGRVRLVVEGHDYLRKHEGQLSPVHTEKILRDYILKTG